MISKPLFNFKLFLRFHLGIPIVLLNILVVYNFKMSFTYNHYFVKTLFIIKLKEIFPTSFNYSLDRLAKFVCQVANDGEDGESCNNACDGV